VSAGPLASPAQPGDDSAQASLEELLRAAERPPRWMGWRLRLLVALTLMALAGILGVAQWLSTQHRLPVGLRAGADGQVKLNNALTPALQRLEGQPIEGLRLEVSQPDGRVQVLSAPINVASLQRSERWIPTPQDRQAHRSQMAQLHALASALPPDGGTMLLELSQLPGEPVFVGPRGWGGITPMFWMLSAGALLLLAAGIMVLLAGPQWRNVGYLVLMGTQASHLLLTGVEANLEVFAPDWFVQLDCSSRLWLDLASAAAMIQVAVLHPRTLPHWVHYTVAGWLVAGLLGLTLTTGEVAPAHWWTVLQAGCTVLALAAAALMTLAHREVPHPFTLILRRFTLITTGCWVLMSLALAWPGHRPDMQLNVANFGVLTWHVFFASQLLLSPYLTQSRQILQEFSLLAASSTVAASLDLLFVAAFSLGQFTSMTMSLFLSFGLYLSLRRWVLSQLLNRDSLSTERLFERLYRIARELERQPRRVHELMARLMRELFDPLEAAVVHGHIPSTLVRGNGGLMLVRLPVCPADIGTPAQHQVLVLRHAGRGHRLFTSEDARLATRIIDQLQRVLSFDQAVEQGRSEERTRIAQDLHDDIGARLLTLMYQAPNPDIEEYIRHTLQDLKTLTRGLSVQGHTLSDAASEWKRDISHRLGAARAELDWGIQIDQDIDLSVVQWSALTRILRELVNNTLAHAKARKVKIRLSLTDDVLEFCVEDDGLGRHPETWSHGLGLGGVRKRVKQLGGTVRWSENTPVGIRCEVRVEQFSRSDPSQNAGPGTSTMPLTGT
jgi:signal transduction histidine kinase